MTFRAIKLSAILMLVTMSIADAVEVKLAAPPVTEECLECICQAKTGCQENLKCASGLCGMFSITLPYWVDAGRPLLNETDETPRKPKKYEDCADDPDCASCATDTECSVRTVRAYMKRFPQDCNQDQKVDCYDYMAIHQKGGYGCSGELPPVHVNLFNQCAAAAAAQRVNI